MSICLIDTSVFIEIINVPGKAESHSDTVDELKGKVERNENLLLPLATIVETGNHIGQNGNGRQRRACAERFTRQVRLAIEGDAPFAPMSSSDYREILEWIDRFPDMATQGIGLGDLSIIADFEKTCELNRGRRVYIWSLDGHLATYSQQA